VKHRLTLTALGIAAISLAIFLFRLGSPPTYLYDEMGYVQQAKSFLDGGQDVSPQHPPLAKIMIAAGVHLFGDNPFGWRFSSALCGTVTLVALFLWVYLLKSDYTLALIATSLSMFNNFLYVMSRVAMLDIFYFVFVMLGILAFTAAILMNDLSRLRRQLLIVCAGSMFGLGAACKWNSLFTLGAIGLISLFLYFKNRHHLREIGIPFLFLGLVIAPFVTYVLAFLPLCIETHRPFNAHELVAMNAYIYTWHKLAPGNPMLSVPWYHWFFRITPERAFDWLMGNFIVLWGGLLALLGCAWQVWKSRGASLAEGFVFLFYWINVLPWIIIPQTMTNYYYYYGPAMFLGVALALTLHQGKMSSIAGVRTSLIIVMASFIFFLYCYPKMADLQAPWDCALGCWS